MAPPTRPITRKAFTRGGGNSGESQGGCGFELVGELVTIALSLASAKPAEIGLEFLRHTAFCADQLFEFG